MLNQTAFSWKRKRVTVTGGAGFLGSFLVEKLLHLGATVRVVDNVTRGKAKNIERLLADIEFVAGDLTDAAFAPKAITNSDVVFDLASMPGGIGFILQEPATILATNLKMAMNTLDAANRNGAGRYLYVSSACVYGRNTPVPNKEEHAGFFPPESSYGWSKICGEQLAISSWLQYGLKTYLCRPFNVYGPREEFEKNPHVIPAFIARIVAGKAPVIYGDGEQTRAYTFVTDVIEGMIKIVASEHVAIPFNLGTSQETSIKELAELLVSIIMPEGKPQPIFKPAIEHDIRRRAADYSRAKSLLGWEPSIGLEEGLRRTIDYYVSLKSKPT